VGTIELRGVSTVGFMFQTPNLFPTLAALQNVRFGAVVLAPVLTVRKLRHMDRAAAGR
jgi:ABC-type polar amino acid transport system ATPase subunit